MSYENLSGEKLINGIPADQLLLSKVLGNQDYLKTESDNDEDLEMLDRSLTPINDNEIDVGSLTQRIKELHSILVKASTLEVEDGTETNLAIKFASEDSGLFKSNPGQVKFRMLSVNPFSITGAGVKVVGANTTQLLIENSQPGQEDTWSIGCDSSGLAIGSMFDAYAPKFKISQNSVDVLNVLKIEDGDVLNPSVVFSNDATTGIFRDGILNRVHMIVTGQEVLKVGTQDTQILSDQLVVPQGTVGSPGIFFRDSGDTGLYSSSNNDMHLKTNGADTLVLGSSINAAVHFPQSLSLERGNLDGPVSDAEVSCGGLSKMFMSTIDGSISVRSFIGAAEGQLLYLIKANTENSLTIKHDDPLASVKILLKDATDYVLGPGYGGLVLSFDVGSWREISRS
jgi:hypothetical protein